MKILILFFVPFITGLFAYAVPKLDSRKLNLVLLFTISYLLAATVLHTLVGLRQNQIDIIPIGLLVTLGFFAQYLLAYALPRPTQTPVHIHLSRSNSILLLVIILFLHAFLEGFMAVQHPSKTENAGIVFWGILLHRAPVAFAMMVLLFEQIQSKTRITIYLTLFCLAAPLGLWVSEHSTKISLVSSTGITFLYALMSGSFLYLSLSVLFDKKHKTYIRIQKLLIVISGLLVAIGLEHAL